MVEVHVQLSVVWVPNDQRGLIFDYMSRHGRVTKCYPCGAKSCCLCQFAAGYVCSYEKGLANHHLKIMVTNFNTTSIAQLRRLSLEQHFLLSDLPGLRLAWGGGTNQKTVPQNIQSSSCLTTTTRLPLPTVTLPICSQHAPEALPSPVRCSAPTPGTRDIRRPRGSAPPCCRSARYKHREGWLNVYRNAVRWWQSG